MDAATATAPAGQAEIVTAFLGFLERDVERGDFRAHFHHIATHDDVVLTERTDELAVGRFRQHFWVYGRFELRDGKIAVWRDSFDWLDIAVSLARAAAGVVAPGLNRPWPGDPDR